MMTRRSLFGLLAGAAALPAVSGEGGVIRPLVEHKVAAPPDQEYSYARIEFTGPALVWKSAVELRQAFAAEWQAQWLTLRPLAKVLAEEGKEIYHTGWLQRDGHVWNRADNQNKFVATLAVYARPKAGASEAYNNIRLARGYWNLQMEPQLLALHERISKWRISTPSSDGRALV